jgi:hypothetical protein
MVGARRAAKNALLVHHFKEPSMQASGIASDAYAKVIANSKRVRWDIEQDVIRGRRFDISKPFMPPSLSLVGELPFLGAADRRRFAQVQGRSYAYIFGLVERFISAKVMKLGRDRVLGDQVALEALVRMTDEELKHQALFRRLEELMAMDMPPGYRPMAEPNAVAAAVLGKSTWAVLGETGRHRPFRSAGAKEFPILRRTPPDDAPDGDRRLCRRSGRRNHALLDDEEVSLKTFARPRRKFLDTRRRHIASPLMHCSFQDVVEGVALAIEIEQRRQTRCGAGSRAPE